MLLLTQKGAASCTSWGREGRGVFCLRNLTQRERTHTHAAPASPAYEVEWCSGEAGCCACRHNVIRLLRDQKKHGEIGEIGDCRQAAKWRRSLSPRGMLAARAARSKRASV